MSGFRIEPLDGRDRKAFTCGSPPLDRYFHEQVSQDVKRRIASCFVAIDAQEQIAGFYTLAATSVAFDKLPAQRAKKLPRYPVVPAVLLGRLAVAQICQGQRLGMALLADAVMRSTRSDVAAHLMVVDAKDEAAVRFYEHFGFQRLGDEPLRLVMAL